MPELPEVEIARLGCQRHLVGRVIDSIEVASPRQWRDVDGGDAGAALTAFNGMRVVSCGRRGKYLRWECGDPTATNRRGEDTTRPLVIHLGMTGTLLLTSSDWHPTHERIRINLTDCDSVALVDPRRFGHLTADRWVHGSRPIPSIVTVAPDCFEPEWDAEQWSRQVRRSSRAVKTLLLDQQIMSGVGNIYADEALWRAGIRGTRRGKTLRVRETQALAASVREVLTDAIRAGQSSIDRIVARNDIVPRYFDRPLDVYGRAGQECVRCHTLLQSTTISGRSHTWCPSCQPPR